MGQPLFAGYGDPVGSTAPCTGTPLFGQFGALAMPAATGPNRFLTSQPGAAQAAIDKGLALQRSRELDAIANARMDQPAPVIEPRVRARDTLAGAYTPFELPPAGPEPTPQQPPQQVIPHPMRVQQVTPGERFAAHAGEAFQNTIAGQATSAVRGGERFARQAEQLDKIIHYAESQGSKVALPLPAELSAPDPLTGIVSPSGTDPNRDAESTLGMPFVGKRLEYLRQLRRDAETAYGPAHAEEVRRQNIRQFQYQTMPGAKTPLEYGAAVAGELAGGLPTPESLVPVTRGPTLLRTFARGAVANGVTNLLADPVVQMAQIKIGTRQRFDPAQPFLGAAGGAFLGGTLNVAPEVAGRIAKVVGAKLGKAADAVTNSDVWQAMSGWVRNPDTMPDDLKVEPRFQSAPDFTADAAGNVRAPAEQPSPETGQPATVSQPAPRFREYGIPVQRPTREPVYQGGVRGEPFVLPPEKPIRPVEAISPVIHTEAGPATVPAISEGAKLTPSTVEHGDIGALGTSVPRSDAQLVSILDRADAKRFQPRANKLYREAAEQQRQAFLRQLDQATAAAADSDAARLRKAANAESLGAHASPSLMDDYRKGFIKAATDETVSIPRLANAWTEGLKAGKAWRKANPKPAEPPYREVVLQTLRGHRTVYRLANDPEVIADFRSRFTRERAAEKFYSVAPGAPPTQGSPRFANQGTLHQPVGAQPAAAGIQAMQPGANYVGTRPHVFNPAVAETGAPIRREDILRDFITGMGIPLYQGRIKSKRILGFFRPSVHEVRVKGANDIETAAHEMAHYIDRVTPEVRRQWYPATKANAVIRQELAGVSYDQKKLFEGFAEFVRLWMTQKNQAQAKAPNFYRWFEGFASRSKFGPTLRQTQERMHNWFEQSATDRAASKIGGDPDINSGLTRWADRFRQSVTDDLHGIANMERGLTGTISPVGAYEIARLSRAAASITEGALTLGRPVVNADGSHSFVGKGLDQILDPVKSDLDNFLAYAVGRSAAELKNQGRENLFTGAEIAAMLAKQTPEFRQAFDEYQQWNRAILDFAQAKGAIDPAKRAQWRRQEYLPFFRVSGGGPGKKAAPGAAPGDWRGIKALTGGTQNLRPILSNIVQNAHTLISAGLTNEARQGVARLASRPGGARFLAKIPKDDKRVLIMKAEIERVILEALGVRSRKQLHPFPGVTVDQIVHNLEPMTALFQRGQAPHGNNIVAVLHGGKPSYYEVIDPILYRAFSALNRPMRGQVMRLLSLPKRVGQTTVTLTVDFMARNIFRDTLMGAIMSRHGFRPFADSAIGFKNRITRDQTYREFLANGGGLGSHLLDETSYRKHLERFITRRGIDYRTVLDAPDKMMFGLGRIAEAFEQATRLGEFRRAIQRGEHPRHAAYSSREVSTDFAMRGDNEVLGFLYDTVVFLKAAVNGLDRLGRGLVEDPNRGRIAAGIGLIALASMGLYAVNRGNPLYEQLEDWDKNTYWHLFIPTPAYFAARAQGREIPPAEAYYHFRLPKLWEIGAVGSIAERQLQGVLDGQPLEAQKQTGKILLQQFNVGLPQIVAPAAELLANRDFFTGRPIENQADKELLPFARSDAYTSSTLRRLGEAERGLPPDLQVSPKVIEHLLHGFFNTWATYGLNALDWATTDNLPTPRLDRLPVVSTFYRQEPAQSTRYVTQLYDAIQAATETRRTMKSMARRWEPEIAQELAARPENLQYRQMTFASKRMQEFRKAATLATDAPDLATVQQMVEARAKATKNLRLLTDARRAWGNIGDLKRLLVDEITRERNAFAESVMKGVNARQAFPATAANP